MSFRGLGKPKIQTKYGNVTKNIQNKVRSSLRKSKRMSFGYGK